MKCLAVCQDELIIRILANALSTTLDIGFIIEDRALARRVHNLDVPIHVGDPRRVDTYLRAGLSPTTCVVVQEITRRSPGRTLEAIYNAGGNLVYLLDVGYRQSKRRTAQQRTTIPVPEVRRLALSQLLRGSLSTELERSLTRARVQQYQRYLSDADRVLILLHNDPDPDAMASGLALRNLLHRTRATAILGTFEAVTRPENLRMAKLLNIQVEPLTADKLNNFQRIATVDVQPHYFWGLLDRVDLVIDHHPPRAGYTAAFKDIRPDYGSTCTILTEHLRAVEGNVSGRTATAMLYAIKSDTLFLSRHTNEPDVEAFRFLYPLANPALVRKMEGAETTLERVAKLAKAVNKRKISGPLYTTHLGRVPREDLITYVADFLLQLEEITWTIVSGIVHDDVVIAVRNLGDSRHAGEFVKQHFGDIGSAGGHRAMAKAVIPMEPLLQKFGTDTSDDVLACTHTLAEQFLAKPNSSSRQREGAPPSGSKFD